MLGCVHEVSVQDQRWEEGKGWVNCEKYVFLANNDDGHYNQSFENWSELNNFITQLTQAGVEAFGPQPNSTEVNNASQQETP